MFQCMSSPITLAKGFDTQGEEETERLGTESAFPLAFKTELFKAWLFDNSMAGSRVHLDVHLSLSVCMSVLLRISCSWTHLMFELALLNDRANCERRPQALLSQGFKGPATRLLSAVTGGDGNVRRRDNPRRTEPRVVCLFDRLINGNPPRKKPLSA